MEFLRKLREWSSIPVIVVSARTAESDKVDALNAGADDYITKPFSMDLLICRMEAIFRRIRAYEENRQKVFQLGTHTFDSVHQTLDGAHLSSRESDLLLMLCRNEGEVVDKHKILSTLWKEDNAFTARSLGVYINHLRGHLRPIGYEIIAVRYKGYKLVTGVTV